jgi:hypothetical protein
MFLPACYGGAILVNGTCELGNCVTPDTLAIGSSSTSLNTSFVYAFGNGDRYQVSSFFPLTNVSPGGGASISASFILDVTYLGNGSNGVSAQDSLTVNLLQNLQTQPQPVLGFGGGYPIFGSLGGGIASGSNFTTQYSEGVLVAPVLGPFTGPGNVSGVQPGFAISGTQTNLTLFNAQAVETFDQGSAVGSFIEVSFFQSVVFNNLPGGPSSTPVVLLSSAPVSGITGSIGGVGSMDYYSFYWPGGAFSASASITGAPNSGASYVFSDGVAGSCNSLASTTLNNSDGFSGTVATQNLAPGQYCIGLNANDPNDPLFSIAFNTAVEGVPEPATFALLLSGLMLISLRIMTMRRAEGRARRQI